MKAWWFLCAGVLLLPGCVVVVGLPENPPTTTTPNDVVAETPPWIFNFDMPVSVNTTVPTPAPVKVVAPKTTPPPSAPTAQLPQSVTVTPCGIFTLPDMPSRPTRVDLTSPDIVSSDQVEKALVDYINVLEDYVDGREKSLSSSYARYIERCSSP